MRSVPTISCGTGIEGLIQAIVTTSAYGLRCTTAFLWHTSTESSRVDTWRCGRYLSLTMSRRALAFSIALDDAFDSGLFPENQGAIGEGAEIRREYVMSFARRRLHQRAFRERVLRAYRHQCALCRLRHSELLDAAHILPDAEPEGEPVVRNGIALCRLHHAAFDRFFLAVRPDCIIEVRADLLEEVDGPTLQHAIQGLHGQPIVLPTRLMEQPATDFLSEKYERFLEVATTR